MTRRQRKAEERRKNNEDLAQAKAKLIDNARILRLPVTQNTEIKIKEDRRITEPSKLRRAVVLFLEILAGCGVVGLVAAILSLYPRPNVSFGDPAIPDDVLSASFTFSNNGYISLSHVRILFSPEVFELSPHSLSLVGSKDRGTRFDVGRWGEYKNFGIDDKFTVTLNELFRDSHIPFLPKGMKVVNGRFSFIIEYNPWIFPFKKEKIFPFRTYKQPNGNLYWQSETLN